MANLEPLGIRRLEAIHYYVRDLERSRAFYRDKLDFRETGTSDPARDAITAQRSAVFEAGDIRVVVSEPLGEGGRAQRWLQKYPDGVGTLIYEVEDIDRAFRLLDGRGGTPISEVERTAFETGSFATFSITTPFGGTTFRFVERKDTDVLYPSFAPYAEPKGGDNRYGFGQVDHVTSNFETMSPALLWMEHVLGFERYWDIEFHTKDGSKDGAGGSGLRSIVMWDPQSGSKMACNEPFRPNFRSSQVNKFFEDNHGDGVQHAALTVKDIVATVRGLRERAIEFMPTPGVYYDMLPARIEASRIGSLDEDLAVLKDLEILVDGCGPAQYLLQIFMKDSAGLYDEREAGPFFYEIIQRKGDKGFGGGNFRALFESIERQQEADAAGAAE